MGRFVLKALTGPVKGQVFQVRNGLKIGRSAGDIILKDPQVSNLHAEIQVYTSGKIMISDQDSKNKILVNNKKTVKSVLEKGDKIQIGATKFELNLLHSSEELMMQFIKKNTKNVKDDLSFLEPFAQILELVFTSGLQKGKKYHASYGPRSFGSRSVDFPIFSAEAPDTAFTLSPDKGKAVFATEHPSLVHFNKEQVKKAHIKDGDQISIGDTVLEIKLKS